MKKYLLSLVFVLSAVLGVNAQNWSKVLSGADGLPGYEMGDVDYDGYYSFASTLIEPGVSTDKVDNNAEAVGSERRGSFGNLWSND